MPASIGVNLRVTGHCRQGGRKYMEDFFSVAYQQTEDEKDLEYAFFGIYDGHGGAEAAAFAKDHLMETIIKHKNFWSDYDEDVLRAIKDGYIATHYAMWREQEKWPRTASGLPSTAGTTASVAFIRRGKIYIGHVGDSGIILGYQDPDTLGWKAKALTRDHKPENDDEMARINSCGGKVVSKSGVPRVVWNRPKIGHRGPVRRSTPIDEIPFLAVARSLGDLWSYNYQSNRFIVSPDPDCTVLKIDTNIHRCLIFGTDGLYNMLSPSMAVHIVQQVERHNENAALSDSTYKTWLNPSKLLVERALERWHATKMRADNTSVVTLMLDPPGPPRAQVLKDRKKSLPDTGLKIMTRFYGENSSQEKNNPPNCDNTPSEEPNQATSQTILETVPEPEQTPSVPAEPTPIPENVENNEDQNLYPTVLSESMPVSSSDLTVNFPLKERNFSTKSRESTSFDPREPLPLNLGSDNEKENVKSVDSNDNTIQCNEVSSSNIEVDNTCNDEEPILERSVTTSKHNLRSGKKGKCNLSVPSKSPMAEETEKKLKTPKRKLEEDQSASQPRKSLRLDSTKKKTEEKVEKERKAFEAEEKLKKLAERAYLVKSKPRNINPKPSLAQKILKVKNIALKKKNRVLNKPVTKKKIQIVLKKMKKSAVLKTKPVVPKVEGKKKGKVLVPAKSSETLNRRNSNRNVSQRQRQTVTKKIGKKMDNEVAKNKSEGKHVKIKSKDKITRSNMKETSTSKERNGIEKVEDRSSISPKTLNIKKSVRHSAIIDTASQKGKPTKVKTKVEKNFPAKNLRIRLQQKTENLKKNVMRKK
ncbi:protein phosphatase 2C [Leptinotarsa decemlineata]|uniref:protein phosphatase 2C n=1 Tax=Leptinotarsa decemlineata TaxID=7539 RepID=UPI003D3065D9